MTTDLDSRLNLAAGSLRRSVAELPISEPRRPGPQRQAAAGLVVLVVAGVVASVLAVRSGDEPVDLEATPAAEVQGLIADPIPEGLQVAWVGEQTAQAAAAAGVDAGAGAAAAAGTATAGPVDLYTYLYGDADAGNPFATSDLVVNVWDSSAAAAGVDAYTGADVTAAATAVNVRGQQGLAGVVDGVTTVRWYEAADIEIVLASHSLTGVQLLALAEDLEIDGTVVALGTVPATVTGSLDEVGQLSGTSVAGARATVASWVGYTGVSDPTQVLGITTLAGGTSELMALVWELGITDRIALRGQEAFVAVSAGVAAAAEGDTIDLVWQEASGVLVHVTAVGMSQVDLLAVIEGLQVSTETQWETVGELAAATQASAAAAVDAATDTAGDVDVDVEAEADAEAEATTDTGAGTSGSAVDAGLGVATDVVTQIEATLQEDLGTAAVVGTVGSAVTDLGAGVGDITGSFTGSADAAAEAGGLLDP